MILYLDYAATTPVHPDVLDEMVRVYREDFGNAGSRTHVYGQRADQLVAIARRKIAELLAIDSHEIIFTSGATESNNLAILGLAAWGADNGRKHILSTTIEHKAILEPLAHLADTGFDIELIPVGLSGRVEPSDLLSRVRDDTLLVTMLHANNETGIIEPVDEIGAALAETPVYFHVDAAQSFGKLVGPLQLLHYDLMSISAHKIQGPQGIGGLVVKDHRRRHAPVRPIMYGGGQERGLRPGTLPVALVVGFGAACRISTLYHEEWSRMHTMIRNELQFQLAEVHHSINGDPSVALSNCLNVSFHGIDSEALMLLLRDQVAVSNGSACSSIQYEPSHVLKAMGVPSDRVESAIRISWGPDMLPDSFKVLFDAVKTLQ